MSQSRRRHPPAVKRPSFLWQGLLIVLPAALLAAFGFYSLRQDRLLAEQQAGQLAQQIADGQAHVVLPRALKLDPMLGTFPEQAAQFIGGGWRRPGDEPLSSWRDHVVCVAKPTGVQVAPVEKPLWPPVLVYPPPVSPLPPPRPLEVDALPSPQQTLWNQALTNLQDGQYAQAAAAFKDFLTNRPPEAFAGVARYRLAICLLRAGRGKDAWTHFNEITLRHSEARGETGLPLAPFAKLKMMELDQQSNNAGSGLTASAPAVPDMALLNEVGAYALLQPSPFSPLLLERLRAIAGEYGQTWGRLWSIHERARQMFAQFLAHTNSPMPDESRSLWMEDESGQRVLARWVSVPVKAALQNQPLYSLVIWPRARLQETIQSSLGGQAMPKYFAVRVEVAGEAVADGNSGVPVLASAAGGGTGVVPELRVAVHLTDRATLYGALRKRRLWFGSLIAASAGAVLIGCFTAWRAFRRQQQLAEMKGNFVSAVSHELRAPIASIRLMSEELEDIGEQTPAKRTEYHRLITQECRRLSSLIENVLDFSRHEQGRKEYAFEPTDLVALVVETVKLMQPCGLERCVALATTFCGTVLPAEADGRALQQALINLIDNAIKHSPDGATVTVGLEFPASDTKKEERRNGHEKVTTSENVTRNPKSAKAAGRATLAGNVPVVCLWVEDHGEGIPPEVHARIFDRFYRRGSELRRETQGIGLGLAIVKYVAEAHGGKVTVGSVVGEGSRFTLVLPVVNHQEAA